MLLAFHLSLDSSDVLAMSLATLRLQCSHRSQTVLKNTKISLLKSVSIRFSASNALISFHWTWPLIWMVCKEYIGFNYVFKTLLSLFFFAPLYMGFMTMNLHVRLSSLLLILDVFGKQQSLGKLSNCQENWGVGAETPELVPHRPAQAACYLYSSAPCKLGASPSGGRSELLWVIVLCSPILV